MDVMPKWADVVLIPLVGLSWPLLSGLMVWPVAKTRGTRQSDDLGLAGRRPMRGAIRSIMRPTSSLPVWRSPSPFTPAV